MYSVSETTRNRQATTIHFVVDYCALNAVTLGDGYPIPNVSNILYVISRGKVFGKLDLYSGYWIVPANQKLREKTAFCTQLDLYSKICASPLFS